MSKKDTINSIKPTKDINKLREELKQNLIKKMKKNNKEDIEFLLKRL